MNKKKVMNIGLAGRNVTYKGDYQINWGTTPQMYNRQSKSFKTRKEALDFKKKLINKLKKKYRVDYMYLAD